MIKKKFVLCILSAAWLIMTSCTHETTKDSGFYIVLDSIKNESISFDEKQVSGIARDYIISGSKFYQEGRYANAIVEYLDALRYDTTASLYYMLAKSYKAVYKYQNAKDYVVKSLDRDSTFVPSLELAAEIFLLSAEYDHAEKAYKQLILLKPDEESKYKITLARLYEFLDNGKAQAIYEALLGTEYHDAALNRLAMIYKDAGDDEKYINALEELYEQSPGNVTQALAILEHYSANENYESLYRSFRKIERDLPSTELEVILLNMTNSFLADTTGKSDSLVAGLLGYIDNKYRFDWRINLFAMFLAEKTENTELADKYAEYALKAADTLIDVIIDVSLMFYRTERIDRAIEILEENFHAQSRFYQLLYRYYYDIDQKEDALNWLKKGFADTQDPELMINIGLVYHEIGEIDSTITWYNKAMAEIPDDALLLNNYAYLLADSNREIDRARKMIAKAIEQEPENTSFLDTYAWVEYRLGNYDKALDYISKALSLGPERAELFVHLAAIYVELGKTEEARDSLQRALELEPKNTEAEKMLKDLE